jgi:hypothetical protein
VRLLHRADVRPGILEAVELALVADRAVGGPDVADDLQEFICAAVARGVVGVVTILALIRVVPAGMT